jgi:hypothetical protein
MNSFLFVVLKLKYNMCAFVFQTKINVAQMEPLQGHPDSLEGQNKTQQCDMEVLAHAV